MKHHALAAVMGLLAAAVLAPGQSEAASADPIGFWMKPDAERNAKIEVTRCGRGGAQLCSKIVWLEDPNDSRGQPLQDVRNENPAMRGRTIVGLPLFNGMTRTGPTTWSGKIYNPEDGNTYAATLTMASRTQIILKGCKAWLLCGQKVWVRTSPPPRVEPEAEEQIEASAEPGTLPTEAHATAAAMPAPAASPEAGAGRGETQTAAMPQVELMEPTDAPVEHAQRPGYGFLQVSTDHPNASELSGENVPSMFVMTEPLETEALAPDGAVPVPWQKPETVRKPAPRATAAMTPKAQPPEPQAPAALAPASEGEAAGIEGQQTAQGPDPEETVQGLDPEDAETATEMSPPLTRRQKRLLRRQQRQTLPWLQ